jgi:hypothetical protein
MNWIIVSLLSIVMVQPEKLCVNNELCNSLYTPSTVHIDSCVCNESTHTFVFSPGYKFAEVNYSLSYPISHDFYQNHTLVGSCPKGLYCTLTIPLEPSLRLVSKINEYYYDDDDTNVTELHQIYGQGQEPHDEYDMFLRG